MYNYQCLSMFFTLNILFDEVARGLGHKKSHFVRYHLYHFFLKIVMGELN